MQGKPQPDSGDDSSEEEKNKRGGSSRNKHEERRRSEKRVKKKKKSLKKRYSSDEGSSGSSEAESYSFSDRDEEKRRRRKKKRRDKDLSDDSYSSSDGHKKRKRHRELKREKKKGSRDFEESSDDDEAREFDARHANELSRKEMGLDWMLRSASKTEKKVEEVGEALEKPPVEEVNRANPKELNPYLRNNGSGYPEDSAALESGAGQLLPSSVVGDGGASWRLKALKRAKEQAAREGQNFSEVVKERWGSLSQLAASMESQRAAPTHAHLQAIRDRKRGQTDKPDTVASNESEKGTEEVRDRRRGYLREVSSRHPEMRKPKSDSLPWKKKKGQPEGPSLIAEAFSGLTKFTNDGSFMETFLRLQSKGASDNSHASASENDNGDKNVVSANFKDSGASSLANNQVLSANQLAAKVLQLQMKGKHDEAEKLSKEMDAMIQQQDVGSKRTQQESNGSTSGYIKHRVSREHKREEDADLHLARKIMSNKKYSLSDRADDEYDFDGEPSRKRKHKRDAVPNERTFAKRILTQHERCQFCFENPSRPKHLVISIANFTYMMLPQWQPVVQGHCCILPMQHESAVRTVDNNVLEEIRNFKKCLIRMFANQDQEVVFMETVIGLAKQQRHCLIECVPIPCQLAKEAPLYFKKAIDEAEDEWGQHEMKKLIQTTGNLRNVIPENFAYFHVEFGLDRGFVHVIDDDNNFRSSFGLNVIRGLLKLPEEDMHRRRRPEPLENQRQAVANFARDWEPFDWTKQLD